MSNYRRNSDWVFPAVIAAAVVVVVLFVAVCITSYAKTSYVNLTIDNKESVGTSNGHEYRIYTSQGTFKVGDSWVHPRWNSADVYAKLEKNTAYRCKVYGWRIPFFSTFKNILECKPVTAKTTIYDPQD